MIRFVAALRGPLAEYRAEPKQKSVVKILCVEAVEAGVKNALPVAEALDGREEEHVIVSRRTWSAGLLL